MDDTVYYINLMFEPLKGGSNAIISQMRNIIENLFYPELCGQLGSSSPSPRTPSIFSTYNTRP